MKDNPFVYSSDNKRYHTLSYFNKNKYGGKVYKAVLDCGFTCPNIDGKRVMEGAFSAIPAADISRRAILTYEASLMRKLNASLAKAAAKSE